jgi:hypothetical protein
MRQSLVRCCESINTQTFDSWQHVIAVDSDVFDDSLMEKIKHPRREIFLCGQRFGNYGNHARWMAWERATASYLAMLDDDNYLAHPGALADIADALVSAQFPDFAIFPIFRHGSRFFNDPPGLCMTDTANVVVKREIGRWPDIEAREADGHWVEALKAKYKYATFPQCPPIITMEYSSNGV